MKRNTLLVDLLTALNVPFTPEWTNRLYDSMTFKSLFGLSHALERYGISSAGYKFTKRDDILQLVPPLMARTRSGRFLIITEITPDRVGYISGGQEHESPRSDVSAILDGTVFIATPTDKSCEPEYLSHRLSQVVSCLRDVATWLLPVLLVFIGGCLTHVWSHFSTASVAAIDIAGLAVSVLLIKKTWHLKSAAADRVCGVVQKGGCDHVLSSEGAKLFGVFSWSEVGVGYFGISLASLVAFPQSWPWLAIFNICCLPYSFWSIWYQRYKAHHWCTLCLTVQLLFWLSFFAWLIGGMIHWPDTSVCVPIILILSYVTAVCALSRLTRLITRYTDRDMSNSSLNI